VSDPRLCSVHLEALPRRQDYRRVREQLLGACGQQTLAIDHAQLAALRSAQEPKSGNHSVPATTQFWLVDRDAVYPLKVGLNTIGRMPDNDVAVLDGSISRRHCAIIIHVTRSCELYDTASKNGTFLNGQRVAVPTRLNSGDRIRLCDRQFVFLTGDPHASVAEGDNLVDDPNSRTHVE
jgi:pSer/pThr/pTyr-binding forkhead associated (FHA) protein